MTPDEVAALEIRVANGITWLDQHDPKGSFHVWWQAGLTPATPLPAHEATPEIRAAWIDYYGRRRLWEQLERKLAAAEQRDETRPVTVVAWQPGPARP